jgi:hypothetical protein
VRKREQRHDRRLGGQDKSSGARRHSSPCLHIRKIAPTCATMSPNSAQRDDDISDSQHRFVSMTFEPMLAEPTTPRPRGPARRMDVQSKFRTHPPPQKQHGASDTSSIPHAAWRAVGLPVRARQTLRFEVHNGLRSRCDGAAIAEDDCQRGLLGCAQLSGQVPGA